MPSVRPSRAHFSTPGKIRLFSTEELMALPPPTWLVQDVLPAGGLIGVYGPPGCGKAQPLDEPTLTPSGWSPLGALQPGSWVIGSAGLPVRVVHAHPISEQEEWIVTFSDGTSTRCSSQHLWTVRKSHASRGWQTRSTEELQYTGHHLEREWEVPITPPISFEAAPDPLPIHPYLLGVLLGDGGLTTNVIFTSADMEVISEVEKVLPADCTIVKQGGNKYAYGIRSARGLSNPIWNALRFLGLAGKKSEVKFVPASYLFAPAAERLALLQGLIDTDGWVQGSGASVSFSSASRQLTEDVQFLVRSLGGLCRPIRTKITTHLDAHVIAFRMPNGVVSARLPRKASKLGCLKGHTHTLTKRIISISRTGRHVPMRCITVESQDGLYLTKDFIVTHNSFLALDMALSVATGRTWQGKAVDAGFVVYVSAEGTAGLGKRILAWLKARAVSVSEPNIAWITEAIPMADGAEEVDTLFARFQEIGQMPVLVILDTLARCFVGDENLQEPMGHFVAAVDRLRLDCGATVLVVHHTSASGDRERGSTAFRGAADAMIRVMPGFVGQQVGKFLRPPQGTMTLVCDKQKEAEPFPVGLGSLIVEPTTQSCHLSVEWLTGEQERDLFQ